MRFYKTGTKITPEVDIDMRTGVFKLTGVSSPENSLAFYRPLINFFGKPIKNKNFTVEFRLIHFNTSSSKCIYDMLKQSIFLKQRGINVTYKWYYESFDLDMLECGEDFADALGIEMMYMELEEVNA